MSELLTTVMNGARLVMKAQAVNANNLANAGTDGFRAELVHVNAAGDVESQTTTPDFAQGMIRTTGNSLDVSVDGPGWIAIQTPEGEEGYTRRGDLRVDALGQLTNGAGQPVLGNGGPISVPPFSALEIASDGTISIQPLGQDATTIAVVDRIKLALPDEGRLRRGEDGIMRLPDREVAPPDASVRVQSGTLEGSNVNAVGELLKMIDLSRQFEAQVRLMKSAEENSSSLASVLSLN
ncbi:MAG TPA: flagellar basal body rod protein FlgF [Pseudomonadales bacterium]